MSYGINLYSIGPDMEIHGAEEGGQIVLRIRNREERAGGSEVMRVQWLSHLYCPEEPLHPDIVSMIAHDMARLAREAHRVGYAQAQRDIRRALGVPEVR